MSRRPVSRPVPRSGPHLYQEDPANPGTCARCHLIRRNEAHVDQLPAVDPAVAAAEARRYGERED